MSLMAVVGFGIALIGLPATVIFYWPRAAIDADGKFDSQHPFPASVTIVNTGNITLVDLAARVRPTAVESAGGGRLIGSPSGPGGITMPDWRIRRLNVGDKWTIPMGGNVPFIFGSIDKGDISVVVTYRPWPLPKFVDGWSTEARLVTHREPNGEMSWIARPR